MRALALWTLLTATAAAVLAEPVTVEVPGHAPLALEPVRVDGIDHITLEEFVDVVRLADPAALIRWDSARDLRLQILGARVSLFTDRALIIVESRVHATDGPLLVRPGDILVPAAALRDLFDLIQRPHGVRVRMPAAPASAEPPLITPPFRPLPEPQVTTPASPTSAPSPIAVQGFTPSARIALVTIDSGDGGAAAGEVADLLSQAIGRGTGREVVIVDSGGDWDRALSEIELARPALVVALQVGDSACPDLEGAGLYFMSPVVDVIETWEGEGTQAMRYRPVSQGSERLSVLIERELLRAGVPWLGRLPAPHRLLRSCPAPAVLVEIGQVSSAADRQRLESPSHRAMLAGAIAQAVIDFCQTLPPARGGV